MIPVPGSAVLNSGDGAEISSDLCASAGNCSAVGSYAIALKCEYCPGGDRSHVDTETNGIWGAVVDQVRDWMAEFGNAGAVTAIGGGSTRLVARPRAIANCLDEVTFS